MRPDAAVLYCENPLIAPVAQSLRAVQEGTTISDLAPNLSGPFVCRYNGAFILRKDWWVPVRAGDVVEFHALAGTGGKSNPLRMILQIVLAIAVFAVLGPAGLALTGWQLSAATAVAMLVGNAIINALVPLPGIEGGSATSSPSYNVSLSANSARRDQPLPVIFGRMRVVPDFASQPYTEYVDNAGDDQYFYALYCIGEGRFSFNGIEGPESILLDDTPLDHFEDVQYRWLPPGSAPSLVLANVVTAIEVSGQEIKPSKFVGGYTACGPGLTADSIGIDVVLQGLGHAEDNGSFTNFTVNLRFDYRQVDDFGTPVGNWSTLTAVSITDATANMVRRSYKVDLPSAMRVEVRAIRTNAFSDNNRDLNTPNWAGMRAYLDQSSPLSSTATHLEIKVRASEQLNGLSQRRIACIVRRMLPTWHPSEGWSEPVETRSIAWAVADVWKNTAYGEGLPDERIDLQTLYELDQLWTARQDYADGIFDTYTDAWTAAVGVAQSGRATPFRRNGVRSLARDQKQTLPVTAFTSRNIVENSLSTQYLIANRETADSIIIEYFDNRIWDWTPITCLCPCVTESLNPMRIRVPFITGATHAQREGLYRAAVNVYRRKISTWKTDMMALLPFYGAAVVLAPRRRGWGQAGDVTDWNGTTLVMTLSEKPEWNSRGSHYVTLMRDDGSAHDTIAVSPGPSENQIVLATAPDFTLILDSPNRSRPKYVFGFDGEHRQIVRVLGIAPQGREGGDDGQPGMPIFQVTAISENDSVHSADEHLLPSGGVVQDPVDPGSGGGGGGGGGGVVINLLSTSLDYSEGISGGALYMWAEFSMLSDGRVRKNMGNDPYTYLYPPDQWTLGSPIEAALADDYEVFATNDPDGSAFSQGAFNTWSDCGVDQVWRLEGSCPVDGFLVNTLNLSIRHKISLQVLGSATINFSLHAYNNSGGQ